MSEIRAAFTDDQRRRADVELKTLVRVLRAVEGSNFEEYHWSTVYHEAKGIPPEQRSGWSNLGFNDFLIDGVGVEWKLLKRTNPFGDLGKSLMHPAATRRIAFDPQDDAETCKVDVLEQWAAHIEEFAVRVAATSENEVADIRWGVLLWAPDLTRFVYFEESLEVPRPNDYVAEWKESQRRGVAGRSLIIREGQSGAIRYSVTLPTKGAKIQPYFDVPSGGEGLYLFEVPPEDLRIVWARPETFEALGAHEESDHDALLRRLLDR